MDAFKTLLFAHAACGTAALATYWAAAFVRKGSPLHRGVGKAYLLAMIGIVVTAIPMAITFYFRGLWPVAVFLGYLTVITSTSMWLGWRSIFVVFGAATALAAALIWRYPHLETLPLAR